MKSEEVLGTIRALLNSRSIPFREVSHQPTYTSEESARARGEDLSVGGKAILMKVADEYKLFVLSAAKRLSSARIKQRFGARSLRFATADELLQHTGLVPGSLPPFGRPILPFDLYIDVSITMNEKVAFNAGSLTTSIILSCKDYLDVAAGEVFEFSEGNVP